MQRYSSKESIAAVFNFAGCEQKDYVLRCDAKSLIVLLDSTADIYNGIRPDTKGKVIRGKDGCFMMDLPPFAAICFFVHGNQF